MKEILEGIFGHKVNKFDLDQMGRIATTEVPSEQLKAAENPNVNIRAMLFQNKNLHDHVWEVLADDEEISIRAMVAEDTPVQEVIEKLMGDPEDYVRAKLVSNKLLSVSDLEKLAQDTSLSVRLSVARKDNLPDSVYKILRQDSSPIVKNELEKNKVSNPTLFDSAHKEAYDDGYVSQCVSYDDSVFGNNCAMSVYKMPMEAEKMINDAQSTSTSKIRLELLSISNIAEVRRAVANNANTPIEVLEDMANNDVAPDIAEDARRNLEYRLQGKSECFGGGCVTTADFAPAVTATMHTPSKKKKNNE